MKLLSTISLILLISCQNPIFHEKEELEFEPKNAPRGPQSNQTEVITFKEISEKVLKPQCIQCHQGYEKYSIVKKDLKDIIKSVNSNRMPKNLPSLDNNLKELLEEWQSQGAPEVARTNPGNTEPTPVEPTKLEPTWNSLSELVFFPKCTTCHNPNGEASFLDLSSRQTFFDNRDYLLNNFENVESSYLIEVITDPDEPMPPPYSGLDRLTEEEVKTITEWIKRGLP